MAQRLSTINREIRFPTQGWRIFFSENFSEIPRKSGGNLPKKGSKIAHCRPWARGGSVFPIRRIWKTDCKGLFWAFWAGLWRLLGSSNVKIPPSTKTAVLGFLGLLGGCRKKSPLRLGSGAGCGCCCGGLGGAVRFDLGRGKAGTRAACAWAILGSWEGQKKSPGAGAAPGLGGYLEIFSSSTRIARGRIRIHRKAMISPPIKTGRALSRPP